MISFIIQFIKIEIHYFILRVKYRNDEKSILGCIVNNGFVIVPDFASEKESIRMLNEVPEYDIMTVSTEGTESRFITDANKNPLLNTFYSSKFLKQITSTIIGKDAYLLRATAQRRRVIGWTGAFEQFFHSDTWKHRVKCFLYLTDVDQENGPLVIAPKTHFGIWRLKHCYELWKLTKTNSKTFLADIDSQFAGTFFPHQSNSIFKRIGVKPVEVTAKKGTLIIFDARCLHKIKPLGKPERVILSSYWIKKNQHV